MPETIKMLIVLTGISAFAGLSLAAFNDQTKDAIAASERENTLRTVRKVLPTSDDPNPCQKYEPRFDNKPDEDMVCVDGVTIYRARKGSEIVGLAFATTGDRAYSGKFNLLVGLDSSGKVIGVEVLRHAETPGLGSKIEDCKWRDQIIGNDPKTMVWKVRKDGGPIDQITGATISSRAMLDGVQDALTLIEQKKDAIMNAAPLPAGEVCNGK
ncbi:MAG: RnfABCDGE type electron transport complex subunit G [Myxococcota bacterium]|jgi:electron transport complex protein RnfG|nr:RnfABCDGE type electron transport complex subunit G [Myxococcota bacterium]